MYTNCRRCRTPLLITESWEDDYMCKKCKHIGPFVRATIANKTEEKMDNGILKNEELLLILMALLGALGLYIWVVT